MIIRLYPGRRTPLACLPWAVMSRPCGAFAALRLGRRRLATPMQATARCIEQWPRPERPLHKSPGQAARRAAPPWVEIHNQGALKGRHITAFHHKISHINKNKSRNHGPISSRFRLEILCTAQTSQAKGTRNASWRPLTFFPLTFSHKKIP